MEHPILMLFVIIIFVCLISSVTTEMMKDKKLIMRIFGCVISIATAVIVLWVGLYCYCGIDLLHLAK